MVAIGWLRKVMVSRLDFSKSRIVDEGTLRLLRSALPAEPCLVLIVWLPEYRIQSRIVDEGTLHLLGSALPAEPCLVLMYGCPNTEYRVG